MPRVSEAHLAARRQQFVEAAARCFDRNGFHQTSIHNVIAEAGLSVGAFYRYFKSKSELIRAIAEVNVRGVTDAFDELLEVRPVPPLGETMAEAFGVVEKNLYPGGPARIAVQVWGEALRDADLHEAVGDIYRQIRSRFIAFASRARESGQLAVDSDPEMVGAALFALVQGYLLQRVLVGGVELEPFAAAVAALLRH